MPPNHHMFPLLMPRKLCCRMSYKGYEAGAYSVILHKLILCERLETGVKVILQEKKHLKGAKEAKRGTKFYLTCANY